ncbi:MAG: 2-phospho-L-lactate guanylyltransferase [Massilia sp.]
MTCWALVPVKARVNCKTRLAGVLTPEQRLALVRKVLAHVLATLQSIPRIDHVAVVSPERDWIPDSIEVLPEKGSDLNTSLTCAVAMARARGASQILILHSDLPYVSVADIETLLDSAETAGIALAPDELHEGTNGLCFPGGQPFPLQFGACSFPAHLASARLLQYNPAVVETLGLGFDLDSSADLQKYDNRSASPSENNGDADHATTYGAYQ